MQRALFPSLEGWQAKLAGVVSPAGAASEA